MRRARPKFGPAALAGEALRSLFSRPLRAVLTSAGTVLGVAGFVATVGLSQTARSQISAQFDLLKASEVRLTDSLAPTTYSSVFPSGSGSSLERLNGVKHAGIMFSVSTTATVSARADAAGARGPSVPILGMDAGALMAEDPVMEYGRVYDRFADANDERVVLVGAGAAKTLELGPQAGDSCLFINGQPFVIIGVLGSAARDPNLVNSIVVPPRTALSAWGRKAAGAPTVLIEVDQGAADVIGRQAPLALRPDRPESISSAVPPEPTSLRNTVEAASTTLFVLISVVSFVVGLIGIAGSTLVSVVERTGEIGLRRALGALRRHIAAQVLCESTLLGSAGGLLGCAVGLAVTALAASSRGWAPTAPLTPILLAPLGGTLSGLLAGIYPAVRAANTEPMRALTTA